MSLIRVQNLTFGYDGSYTNIFENVSFGIDTDWKLGFVGRNGRGKTTFLRLLMGEYEYGGSITANVKFAYFPFSVPDKTRLAYDVLQDVCPTAQDWEVIRELSYLNMDADVLYRPFCGLSSGEQTKLLLAGLFLGTGEFLLIDEPTNHLDVAARQLVARYLRKKKGFILVSHDRAFLDGCVDHILAINKTNIEVQSGNFSSWWENFARRQAFESAQNERLQKDIERLNESAKRTAAWSERGEAAKYGVTSAGLKADRGYVGHKAAKMMKRAKVTEARQARAIEQKKELLQDVEYSERLKLFPQAHRSERLLLCSDLEIFYGERKACGPINFELLQGERIVLSGKNGCGKSSLLKVLTGAPIRYTGSFVRASGLAFSVVPQIAEFTSVQQLSEYASERQYDESLFKAILHKLGFAKKDFDGAIAAMSEGQKKKVLLAGSLCEKAHVYVWDEPLNFIDVYSRMQIEDLLKEFRPTMLFVEHDKTFCDAIATKTVTL